LITYNSHRFQGNPDGHFVRGMIASLFNLGMSAELTSDILLDTIHYLEQRKAQGARYIRISPELLQDDIEERPAAPQEKPVQPTLFSSPAGTRWVKTLMTPERRTAFEALRTRVLGCEKCPHLVRSRTQVVFGIGNPDTDLMFVGEAPGADEDKQGEPFVGRAGQLLTKMIQTMGFARADVYIGNVLKCRPDMDTPSGNRKPTPEEMATCIPYLKEQIQLIQPRVLMALGDTAIKGLLPGLKEGISKLRGRWHEFEGIPLMPTFHPAYLLHNQSLALKRLCWEDMLAVLEKLERPISEKQRKYFLSALSGQTPS